MHRRSPREHARHLRRVAVLENANRHQHIHSQFGLSGRVLPDRDTLSRDHVHIEVVEIRRVHVPYVHDDNRNKSVHEQHFHNDHERRSLYSHMSPDFIAEASDSLHKQNSRGGRLDHQRHHDPAHHLVLGRGQGWTKRIEPLQLQHNLADEQLVGRAGHETVEHIHNIYFHADFRHTPNVDFYLLRVSRAKTTNRRTEKQEPGEKEVTQESDQTHPDRHHRLRVLLAALLDSSTSSYISVVGRGGGSHLSEAAGCLTLSPLSPDSEPTQQCQFRNESRSVCLSLGQF